MEALSRILERICHHARALQLPLEPGLNDGLSQATIAALTQDLPFSLPGELVTLYCWRNGTQAPEYELIWNCGWFLPLDEAMTQYQHCAVASNSEFWEPGWFPVFDFFGDLYVVQCPPTPTLHAPVWYIELTWSYMAYDSLTSMLETAAACYETGAYRLNAQGNPVVDYARQAEHRRAYNPQWVAWWLTQVSGAQSIMDLIAGLQRHEPAPQNRGLSVHNFASRALEELLEPQTIAPLKHLARTGNDKERSSALVILAAFGNDARTLPALREGLHDPAPLTRGLAESLLKRIAEEA